MDSKFCHLHVHSDYSLLTGMSKVKDLVKKAKNDGMTSLALTDLGNMYGIIEFVQECKKNNIKPIIGTEIFIAPNGMRNKRPRIDEERHSLVLLAKNNVGYKNLLRLTSRAHTEGFYYKPRIDLELLKDHSEGLIGLSSSLHGEIPKAILKNFDQEKLDAEIGKYTSIFGKENFFIEIIRHPHILEQELVNKKLIEAAQRNGLEIVAAANSYYLNTEDDKTHDILLCIQNNRKIFETNRFTMVGEDYSLLSQTEIVKRYRDIPQAVETAAKIAEMCDVTIEFGKNILPAFNLPEKETNESYLRKICFEGLVKRYGGSVENGQWLTEDGKKYIKGDNPGFTPSDILDRLEYELQVIDKTGFASYFLIVSDFIRWAKSNGVVVGPGRGSAGGSIVAYLTDITDLDPIAYNLMFERFLNPERISMPDIDTDFADTRRDEVIQYVKDKYGADHVSGIATFGTLGAKAVIRDVGRALGIEYALCDKISKMIPQFTDLKQALEEVPDLAAEYKNNKECRDIIDNALKLEGLHRHASVHACGILITKDPLEENVPVQFATDDEDQILVSQYSLHPIEDLGLLKMDFLGLKNLTIIENTLEAIEKIHDVKIVLSELEFNDPLAYELLGRGETTGVFQFESSGMKRYLKALKPSRFEDLVAMGALYRPGPLDAGMVDEYIERKNGLKELSYEHPLLEPILKNTFGVIVYQEQVMQIARDLAGFTLGQADVLRKAVGKKIKELMDEQKVKLLDGMNKKNIAKKTATEIWRQIETFARYGFNRSHAACYAVISYQTAFLKAHYPAEFMASLLTSDLDDLDRISIEISECRAMGIDVLLPDVNESFSRFTVVAESLSDAKPRIRFGLAGIKGLGDNIARAIIRERKDGGRFVSLEDFLTRISAHDLNKKSLDALIRSGALDSLGQRSEMLVNMETLLGFSKEIAQQRKSAQESLFGAMPQGSATSLQLVKGQPLEKKITLSWEKELLGFYLSEHPFADYEKELGEVITPTQQLQSSKYKGHVRVGGLITAAKKIVTKKGEIMLFATVEDTRGSIEIVVFPSVYAQTAEMWQENTLVIVSGSMSERDDEVKIIGNEVKLLDDATVKFLKNRIKKVELEVKNDLKNLVIFFNKIADNKTIGDISELLGASAGKNKVILAVPIDDKKFRKIETNFSVDLNNSALISRLNQITDVKFVKIM
jgi:DNA polymerase-3 subunit alpha